MLMKLFHGRSNPDSDMEELGSDGPVLHGVKYVKTTYKNLAWVGFNTVEDYEKAKAATGWTFWDNNVLEVVFLDDMIKAGDAYYGDWEIQDE